MVEDYYQTNALWGYGLVNKGVKGEEFNLLESFCASLDVKFFYIDAEALRGNILSTIQGHILNNIRVFYFINTQSGGTGINMDLEVKPPVSTLLIK